MGTVQVARDALAAARLVPIPPGSVATLTDPTPAQRLVDLPERGEAGPSADTNLTGPAGPFTATIVFAP